MSSISSLLGGIGLFLLGMWLMTDGLKLAAGEALKGILENWTRSPARAFGAGFMITGLVQSSTATTVATVGFVNAGLLTLAQAVWVVVGANVGTTLTGWIVAVVGVNMKMGAIALPLIGVGMMLRLSVRSNSRAGGIGQALAGFGAFFMGLDIIQEGFAGAGPALQAISFEGSAWVGRIGFVLLGLVLTIITQSSAASLAIVLSASATGDVPLDIGAAAVIGINIGTTSTAVFSAIGATPAAQRVAASHVIFNAVTGIVALVLLPPLVWMSSAIAGLAGDAAPPIVLAVFHTTFSLLGTVLMIGLGRYMVAWLEKRFVSTAESVGRPVYLDDTLAPVPQLALRGLVLEVRRLLDMSFDLSRQCVGGQGATRAQEAAGLHQLARRVRGFVSKLGSDQLPDKVADALPDLIRATQNIEDLVLASAGLDQDMFRNRLTAKADWRALHEALLDCLTEADPDDPPAGAPQTLEGKQQRLQAVFDALKRRLLRDATSGQMSVDAMSEELSLAEACRHSGELAIKARQRLEPWTTSEVVESGETRSAIAA